MLFDDNSIIDSVSSTSTPYFSSSNTRKASTTCDINDVFKCTSPLNDTVFLPCGVNGTSGSSTSDPTQLQQAQQQQLTDSYESYIKRLDDYYQIINAQLIEYQSPTTGLFPIFGSKTHKEGHVRDSIYCAVTIWLLRQAYAKIDNDKGRTHELGQSAVKCMRGILFCWLKQANKLEKFKMNQSPENALHTKFHIRNGGDIEDKQYGHLQIDCVSLYLLYLAQMISSGLQIIYSPDEVSFIQNLIFYVERAYRTPDYGIWERGSKYNNNECELHASSIGMAKAALEAMNGFDLYGDNGCNWSVVYVDIDAHNRNRTTLETLLPRESSSKNIDTSTITVVGFPAFSVHDTKLVQKTISKCTRRLKGNYGFKRFLRDGANCVLENKEKKFYESSEIKNFDGIECEYPIFYCYFLIYNIFTNNLSAAQSYYETLLKLVRLKSILPHYYYLKAEALEAERLRPLSQPRFASPEIEQKTPHLWTQAMWIMGQLLVDKVIGIQDLDPIRRYMHPSERPKQSKRYSTFRGFYTDLTINICCIAESVRLQQLLANYGIQTQTPKQVEPIEIWPPSELVKAHETLGENRKLQLSGRPRRPIGVLGTSKMYRICSQRVICYPLTFETNDFYMSSDLGLLLDDVRNDLEFLSKSWKLQGRPLYVFIIKEQNLRGPQRTELLELLSQFKQGNVNGVSVRMDRLQTLISAACFEHLDFLEDDIEYYSLKELETDNTRYKSLSDLPREMNNNLNDEINVNLNENDFKNKSLNDLIGLLNTTSSRLQKAYILNELVKRYGINLQIDDTSVEDMFMALCAEAATVQNWRVVRFCTSILHKTVDSLAPSITNLLVRGKILTLGVFGHEEIEITNPLTPDQFKNILYKHIYPYDIYLAVLMQELIINISKCISTAPEMFNGIIKLRLGWIVDCMRLELEESKCELDENLSIYSLSPNEIKQLMNFILTCNNSPDRNIYRKRYLDGALNRVPNGFYECVWSVLKKSPGGIKIYDYHLPQQPTLSDMTDYELNFSLKVEEMLSRVAEPVYRQIVVEMFIIVNTILSRNPEFQFTEVINIDKMISQAIDRYCQDHKIPLGNKDAFFSENPSIYTGTSAYLSRVCIENLINYTKQSPIYTHMHESTCRMS